METLGSPEKTVHWMNRTNPELGGKTPREVIKADPVAVEAALVRIDHGIYS
jgi:uncharacterized protein (DUF2384 family)